jgi:integrase
MPATQRGQPYKLGSGRWGLRYYDEDGRRKRVSPFPSKSAALDHFERVIRPRLRGEEPAPPEMTLSELVDEYLKRHAATRRPRTIVILRERLKHATDAYGDVPLREFERMSADLAEWQTKLSPRYRYGIMQALRQTLAAAVRWGWMRRNPAVLAGPNPQPPPRTPDPFTLAEVDAIADELGPLYGPLVRFAAATGLRPQEWAALERRDVDRPGRVVNVRRTVADGVVRELAKTDASRRQVPLSARALAALDILPPRLDTLLLFPAVGGGPLNLDNWRQREWAPALEAAGVRKRRIYDLRSTYISNALHTGVLSVFEVAKVAGTSVQMIERHYGALLDGSAASMAARLSRAEAALEKAAADAADEAGE